MSNQRSIKSKEFQSWKLPFKNKDIKIKKSENMNQGYLYWLKKLKGLLISI